VLNVSFAVWFGWWRILVWARKTKLESLARSEMRMSRNHTSRQHFLLLGAAFVAIVVFDVGIAAAGSSRGWTNRNWYPQLTSRGTLSKPVSTGSPQQSRPIIPRRQ
jgi:hypothetical protein